MILGHFNFEIVQNDKMLLSCKTKGEPHVASQFGAGGLCLLPKTFSERQTQSETALAETIMKILQQKKILVAAALFCAAAGGFYFFFSDKAGAVIPAENLSPVRRMNIEEVVTSLGTLEPATYVDVGAQTSGQLMKLYVELSDVVQKGDLLAEIDPRTHAAKVVADKASLANLQASLAEREAKLVQAKRDYERDSKLFKDKATSESIMQSSETEYRVCMAQVDAIKAQIEEAKANLESDELNLSYCKIYAPISGTVVSLDVKEGQTINSSQTAPTLMRIADLEVMTVWASVSEADINKLQPGMDVYFTTIGDNATRYYAKVDKIHPSYTEENDVILYDVVFNVDNPGRIFLPAMNTQVFFVRAQADNVLVIPISALSQSQRNASEAMLTVMLPGGKNESRRVGLGVRTRTFVEVVSGLEEGETISLTAQAGSKAASGTQGPPPGAPGPGGARTARL